MRSQAMILLLSLLLLSSCGKGEEMTEIALVVRAEEEGVSPSIDAIARTPEPAPANTQGSNVKSGYIPKVKHAERGFVYEPEAGGIRIEESMHYDDPDVVVPAWIDGKPVEVIGGDAFGRHTELLSVTLPPTVKTIENAAFYRCYSLEEVCIPASVTQMGPNPFFRCSSLQAISVDSENAFFSDLDGVLFDRDGSTLLVYPEGRLAESYTVPDTVRSIDGSAFGYHCRYLQKLTILSNVTELERDMFIFPEDITLVVETGSAAEQYAKQYELHYELYK